jgi:hypothetical protein
VAKSTARWTGWRYSSIALRDDLSRKVASPYGPCQSFKVTSFKLAGRKREELTVLNNVENPIWACRDVTFRETLFIERDDFMEDTPNSFSG